ncbi:hypothetical protein CRE_05905 [Caenorhabditis remanei]|uniref:Uncharacterized protein n=1 Tax=Caenorhabditis remanei TaxID=31234 RepID=E3MNP4_CAERE|nr:hypothetical protein CRE_05905 [Caenorhabditis remanei]
MIILGGKEFRSTNEAIMEVHATRLMAQLGNSCLAGGITSRTHIDDTRIRRTVGCVGAGLRESYFSTAPNTSYSTDDQIQVTIKLLTVTNNYSNGSTCVVSNSALSFVAEDKPI